MKNWRKFLLIPACIVIAVTILSGFSNPDAQQEAQNLIKQRTTILQRAFYQQITLNDAEKRLSEIETNPLLADDIHSLRDWEATQLDLVRSMNIASFSQEKNLLGYLTYRTVIYWDMSGLSGNYTMRGDYHVVIKKESGGYKLSVFDPQNK